MKVLVDTNIVLRMRAVESTPHDTLDMALERLVNGDHSLHFCTQVAIEFWSVATRPVDANGLGLSTTEAQQRMRYFSQLLEWLPEPADIGQRWLALVSQHEVKGKQVHDARLVALMQAHGITHLLTLNTADFARFTNITPLHPSDVT